MTYRAGGRHPEGVNTEAVLGYAFILPASNAPRDLWLRLRSTSAHLRMVQALPADQLAVVNTRSIAWSAFYAALSLLILLAFLALRKLKETFHRDLDFTQE